MKLGKETIITVPTEQLVCGLFIDLKLPWLKHPFASARFKISSQKEIDIIRQLKPEGVLVYLDKSDAQSVNDLGRQPGRDASDPVDSASQNEEIEQALIEKATQAARSKALHAKRREVRRDYQRKAKMIKQITSDMKSRPANAIHNADEFVDEMAALFEGEGSLLARLVELGNGQHSDYNHTTNVTMLGLMLGSAEGLTGAELKLLGTGALLHDIGKIEIPAAIRNKAGELSAAEKGVLEHHPLIGRRLVERVRPMPADALNIIEQHHELLDGSGYPAGLKADQLSLMVRIVAIVNLFDDLCNPPDIDDAMTPKNALAVMYKHYQHKLDRRLVTRLIEILGIYPPGTVVELSDESIGLVISTDLGDKLRPAVLVYEPDTPKEEALILDLMEYPGIQIVRALRPGEYPSEIHGYFGIKERLGYMVEKQR